MKTKVILLVAIVGVIALSAYFYIDSSRVPYHSFPHIANVCGVDIYSKISVTEFQTKKGVYLFTTQEGVANTCNFEISAVSTPDREGYRIHMEREPMEENNLVSWLYVNALGYEHPKQGIYLDDNSAYIRGESDEEFLKACHIFLCLREGMDCPENLLMIRNITLNQKDIILVLDNKTGAPAVRAYAELLGVLGFVQAQIMDANKNGVIEQEEVDENKVWIYPYVMSDGSCKLQPFRSAIEILNITNDTTKCDFRSGIYLLKSDKNEIRIEGSKVIISGDDEHIHTGAVIVRDILSPEWMRVYYSLE